MSAYAQPYLMQSTSISVYILQWQVILFIQVSYSEIVDIQLTRLIRLDMTYIQGLLLVDAELTSSVGDMVIGWTLLALNILLALIIGIGAQETVNRATVASSYVAKQGSDLVRRGSAFRRRAMPRFRGKNLEVEMAEVFPSGEGQSVVEVENPMTRGASNPSTENVLELEVKMEDIYDPEDISDADGMEVCNRMGREANEGSALELGNTRKLARSASGLVVREQTDAF